MTEAINDDVFQYEGASGMKQCISGFGRNAIEQITGHLLDCAKEGNGVSDEARECVKFHIEELVRWCRGLNSQAQGLAALVAKLPKTADGVPVVPGMHVFSLSPQVKQIIWEWVVGTRGTTPLIAVADGEKNSEFTGNLFSTREAAEAEKGGAK